MVLGVFHLHVDPDLLVLMFGALHELLLSLVPLTTAGWLVVTTFVVWMIVSFFMYDLHFALQVPLLRLVMLCEFQHGVAHLPLERLAVTHNVLYVYQDVALFAGVLLHFEHQLVDDVVLTIELKGDLLVHAGNVL